MLDSAFLHFLVVLFLYTIPLWPPKYLKYLVYAPLIISFSWFITDGCFLTKKHNEKNNKEGGFTYQLLKKVFPNISKKTANRFVWFSYMLVITLSFRKLCANNIKP